MSDPRITLQSAGSPEVLTITLDYDEPLELAALSQSFYALARQHARHADRIGATINEDRVKLYVREIRSGSVILELVALAQTAAPLVTGVTSVVSFAKEVAGWLSFGTGKSPAPPLDATPRDARDLSAFVQPVAADARATMTIQATDSAQVRVTNLFVDSNSALAAQARLGNWAAQQVAPVNGIHEQQLLYFAQASGDPAQSTGDRGVIERFGANPVKTLFANTEAKESVVHEALFQKLYVVDVDVQTVDGNPRLYRILKVHESMDR